MSWSLADHEIIATVILPFRWLKKGSYQLLVKVCAQVQLNKVKYVQEKCK